MAPFPCPCPRRRRPGPRRAGRSPARRQPGPGFAALALLLGILSASSLHAAPVCRELRQRRDGLAAEAMQAEIALVMNIRQRLCPAEETAAEQANALARSHATSSATPSAAVPAPLPLDYQAFIRCREQAERLLRRARPVLFRNGNGFFFYTATGARLARQAEALQPELAASCPGTPASAASRPAAAAEAGRTTAGPATPATIGAPPTRPGLKQDASAPGTNLGADR